MNKSVKILEIKNLSKSFIQEAEKLEIIKNASLTLNKGESAALVGPSGCGKTTFLQMLALLDRPTSGTIKISGEDCSKVSEKKRTLIRRKHIGFIYQLHHLLPEFTALQNAALPLLINGMKKKEAFAEAEEILVNLGLKDRINFYPAKLSGGQAQRVAIARSIIHKPDLLLADEPTGNLDPKNAELVFEILLKQITKNNLTNLIVTHNLELAKRMQKIYQINNGRVTLQK